MRGWNGLTRASDRSPASGPASAKLGGFFVGSKRRNCRCLKSKQGPSTILRTVPLPTAFGGRAELGATMSSRRAGTSFTDDDHAVWDLLFARQVELLGSRVVSAFLDGIDLLKLSHPGVPDVEGLNAILSRGPAGGRSRCRGWCRTRSSSPCWRARVPGRQFHPQARAARLSRSARLLPRHVRAHPDACAPRFCRDGRACRRARVRGDRGRRRRPGGAALLAQRRVRAGAGAWRAQDPRRRPRIELRRIAFQPRERRGRAAALLGRAGGPHALQHDAFQPRYLVSRIARADGR